MNIGIFPIFLGENVQNAIIIMLLHVWLFGKFIILRTHLPRVGIEKVVIYTGNTFKGFTVYLKLIN